MTDDLQRSPIHDRHSALGAKFAPFVVGDDPNKKDFRVRDVAAAAVGLPVLKIDAANVGFRHGTVAGRGRPLSPGGLRPAEHAHRGNHDPPRPRYRGSRRRGLSSRSSACAGAVTGERLPRLAHRGMVCEPANVFPPIPVRPGPNKEP